MLLAHSGVAEEFARLEISRQDAASQVLRQDIYSANGDGFSVGVKVLDLLHGLVVDDVARAVASGAAAPAKDPIACAPRSAPPAAHCRHLRADVPHSLM